MVRESLARTVLRRLLPRVGSSYSRSHGVTLRRFEAVGIFTASGPTASRSASAARPWVVTRSTSSDAFERGGGRVQGIEAHRIVLDRGELPTGPDVLHVDCTAQGLPVWAPRPIFEPDRITLQSVLFCQPSASAALIAAVELALADDTTRNATLKPTLPPERPEDMLTVLPRLRQHRACMWHKDLRRFVFGNRLSMVAHEPMAGLGPSYGRRGGFRVDPTVRRIAASMPPRQLQVAGDGSAERAVGRSNPVQYQPGHPLRLEMGKRPASAIFHR